MSLRSLKKARSRQNILTAAQQLITKHRGLDFSMQDLADEAEVSFATLYNYFGSKEGVCRAIFDDLIKEVLLQMENMETYAFEERLFSFVDISVSRLVEKNVVFRTVCNAMTVVSANKQRKVNMINEMSLLWHEVIRDEFDYKENIEREMLSQQLAISYRGALSAWLNHEIDDEEFKLRVTAGVLITLLSVVTGKIRASFLKRLETTQEQLNKLSKSRAA